MGVKKDSNIMSGKENRIHPKDELDDDEKIHITEIFHEDVAPRLMRMAARIGNINCEFAGEQYKNWLVEFRSTRTGFEIVDFEYDEDARSINLPPQIIEHV